MNTTEKQDDINVTSVADQGATSSSSTFFTVSSKTLVVITLLLTMIVGLQQQQIKHQEEQQIELENRVEELRRILVETSSKSTTDSITTPNGHGQSQNLRTTKTLPYSKVDYRPQYDHRNLESNSSDNNTCSIPYTLASDFGVVGDGITDDTDALQAAINAASASTSEFNSAGINGGTVLLPAGLFYTTGSITIPAGVTLQGQGYGSSPLSIQFDAGSSTIAYCGTGTDSTYAVRIVGHGASMRDLAIYDKHCDGVFTNGGGIIVDADGAGVESVVLSNLLIYHFMGGPALHLRAQNSGGIAYNNFQNIRVRHAKEGILLNAEDGSFVNSNSFLGGAISGGITDIALHAEGPGACNDNKFYGMVIEPSETGITHVYVTGAKTNIRLLDVRMEGTEMEALGRPLIIIDDSSYGNIMNGVLGHSNIQADFNRNPGITFTTNKMVGVHPSPSNLLWNDGFHGLTADLTNGGGSMNGWSMPGQNWFGTVLDLSEDIYPNHRVLAIDYRGWGGPFKLQPQNLPPSPAHSYVTFGVFVRSSVPNAISAVMRSQHGSIMSSSSNTGTPNKWEWVGMSSLYDKTNPYFYFNIIGDVEITAPYFAYGKAQAVPGTSFLSTSGGQIAGTLTLGVVDGFVPPGSNKPLNANVNEWTLPTSDGNHFIVDSSSTTGSDTLVTRINAVGSTRFAKGTLITLLFPYAGITVKGNGSYIKLLNQQDFTSTVHSSLMLLAGDYGTWSQVLVPKGNVPTNAPPPAPVPSPSPMPKSGSTKVFAIEGKATIVSPGITEMIACQITEKLGQESCPNNATCTQVKCEEIQSSRRRLEDGISVLSKHNLVVNSELQSSDLITEFIESMSSETTQGQALSASGVSDASFLQVTGVEVVGDFNYEISFNSSCTHVSFNDAQGSEELKFCYNISDKPAEMRIFNEDCNTEVTDHALALVKTLRWDSVPADRNDHIEFHIDVNQSTIQGSNIWAYNDATKKGNITFCMRLDLYADKNKTFSVNFYETVATITVDMSQGFSVEGISTDRNEAANITRSTSTHYTLDAYQCKDTLGTPSNQVMSQASILGLCIDLGADVEGTQFDDVLNLTLTQDNNGVSSTPILSGQSDGLTSVNCEANEGKRCFIQTIVVSKFFTPEAGNANITASGTVLLKFGRRQLNRVYLTLPNDSHKEVQEEGINRFLQNAEEAAQDFRVVIATEGFKYDDVSNENGSSKDDGKNLTDIATAGLTSILVSLVGCSIAVYFIIRRKISEKEAASEEMSPNETPEDNLCDLSPIT